MFSNINIRVFFGLLFIQTLRSAPPSKNNSSPLCPQGPLGVWRSGHGRKAGRKPLSSDLSVGQAGNRKSGGRLELSEP